MSRFYVLTGPRAGESFEAGDKRLVVGRDPECDLTVQDDRMSRKHLALAAREGRMLAIDLGSSNGTFVNGELIAERALEEGDILLAGQTKIRYGATPPPTPGGEEGKPDGNAATVMMDGAGPGDSAATTPAPVGECGPARPSAGPDDAESPFPMSRQRIEALRDLHRSGLLEDTLPFWLEHAVDREWGGYLNFLAQDGSVYGTDKPGWILNRFVWLLSLLHNEVEPRGEWRQTARYGIEFIRKHLFDDDGRMFFLVTRDGRPLRKRRYVTTEMFGVIAFSEYARAAQDEAALETAWNLYRLVVDCFRHPERLPPKFVPGTRPMKSHGSRMCLLATTQQLRKHGSDPLLEEVAEQVLFEILNHFMRQDEQALLEAVGPNGERLDGPEGRCVNPGHAIETAWFLMEESRQRGRSELVPPAIKILDWSLRRGWDPEYGGILYFTDVEGKPCVQYEHDMKLWWPHNEALYATLLALRLTGERRWADWHEKIHEWVYARFPDREHGEWFKYLHRDGTVSVTLKGNGWAGPFHLPRMQFLCWRLLDEMLEE